MNFLGTRLGLRKRPAGRTRMSEPQAEFARASRRGLRRVRKFIQDAKGICKK